MSDKQGTIAPDICAVEPTYGFRLYWNQGGGLSILQGGVEGGEDLVCLTVDEAERLLEGLADCYGYKLQKRRRAKQ
jgi:hypothetical protein